MNIEQIFFGITATLVIVLSILTLQRLLSGWWRQYYLLALVLVLLLAQAAPPIASYVSNGNWSLVSAQRMYWALTLASQVATFLLVMQLILRIGRELPHQAVLVRMLSIAAVAVALASVIVHMDRRTNTFMTLVTRDLTFLTALLNMILWRFLIQLRKRDFLVLAVSAGLGIQCTGDAIGHSFRILAKQMGSTGAINDFGAILMALSGVITLAIWHTAFARRSYRNDSANVKLEPRQPGVTTSTPANTHSVA